MKRNRLMNLFQEYKNAPKEFQATSYWDSYEKGILDAVDSLDLSQLRSGKYPILATFGFGEVTYFYHPNQPLWKKIARKLVHRYLVGNRSILPYGLSISAIRETAYHHCELMANSTSSFPISGIEVSTFGNPQDIFEVNGRKYTMVFLGRFIRYCFSNKYVSFKGDELVVELGSGSGHQVEVLKKIYPNMTLLCFDLPAQIYLCEQYLTQALGIEDILGTDVTSKWNDLSGIKKGKVHLFGNWQVPLLRDVEYDVFWNAASFGEMEPDVVKNYLKYVTENAKWIYLLQARHGKERTGRTHVKDPVNFDDYNKFLSGYVLQEERDAWGAHRKMDQSGGYFEGVWKKK